MLETWRVKSAKATLKAVTTIAIARADGRDDYVSNFPTHALLRCI